MFQLPLSPDEMVSGEPANYSAAFRAVARALNSAGGGTIELKTGKTYVVGEQDFAGQTGQDYAYQGRDILRLVNCTTPVVIKGNGALLKADASLKYGAFDPVTGLRVDLPLPLYEGDYIGNAYRGMLQIEGCDSVSVSNLELDGNAANLILGGEWGDSQRQLMASGVYLKGNKSVSLTGVNSHHHACDGIQVINPGLSATDAVRPHSMRNVVCRSNTVTNGGELIATAPRSGVDIEPEGSVVRGALFEDCTFKDNGGDTGAGGSGAGAVSASGDSSGVIYRRCVFTGESFAAYVGGKPDYIFEDCTFVGFTNFALVPGALPFKFTRCLFTNDPALTESGTVNTAQSLWPQCYGGVFVDCVIDTGAGPLPMTPYENTASWENCTFRTQSAGPHGVMGRFRGSNVFEIAGENLFLFDSGYSAVESGSITVNGQVVMP
jgi:hypothetical protein